MIPKFVYWLVLFVIFLVVVGGAAFYLFSTDNELTPTTYQGDAQKLFEYNHTFPFGEKFSITLPAGWKIDPSKTRTSNDAVMLFVSNPDSVDSGPIANVYDGPVISVGMTSYPGASFEELIDSHRDAFKILAVNVGSHLIDDAAVKTATGGSAHIFGWVRTENNVELREKELLIKTDRTLWTVGGRVLKSDYDRGHYAAFFDSVLTSLKPGPEPSPL